MAWQNTSGYNQRAKVEATIGRWKQVIGDGLHSRIDERREPEVDVAVYVLNRMLEIGAPCYVRIPLTPTCGIRLVRVFIPDPCTTLART